eukprot:s2995_g1.t1
MLTVFNDVIRRGHRPRDAGLRSVMVSLGLPVPAEERRAPEDPERHSDDESVDLDENAEEESRTEDEIVTEEDPAVEPGPVDPAVPGGVSEDMAWHAYIYQEQGLVSFGSAATTALSGDQEHGLVSFAGAATLDCPGDRKDGPFATVPQLPADYEELLDRTKDQGLKELCFFYLSSHLYVCNPDRRCSRAKLAASRRSYQLADPADLYEFVRPQIEGAALQQLKADYQALEMFYKRTLAENDLTWVLQCGKEKDPPQRIMLETLGRMLQQTLMRVLDKGSADFLMPILCESCHTNIAYWDCTPCSMTVAGRSSSYGTISFPADLFYRITVI